MTAFSMSPPASSSARLQSMNPAPVRSRRSLTAAAVISMGVVLLFRGWRGPWARAEGVGGEARPLLRGLSAWAGSPPGQPGGGGGGGELGDQVRGGGLVELRLLHRGLLLGLGLGAPGRAQALALDRRVRNELAE